MNKKQILSSLNNIANYLDNNGFYKEATSLTKTMKKIAIDGEEFELKSSKLDSPPFNLSDEDKDLLKHYPHKELHDSNLSAQYNDKQTIWLAVQKIESLLDQILKIARDAYNAYDTQSIERELEDLRRMLDYEQSLNQLKEPSKNQYGNQVEDLVYKISEIYIQTMSKLNPLDSMSFKTFVDLTLDEKIIELSKYDEDDYYDQDEEERY